MKHLVADDRGLGTAYERYCFYQLLDAWAASFGVETLLEGPVDGMAGVAGVHGVGLAKRGVEVISAVPSEEHARVARGIYATCNAPAQVIVSGEDDLEKLPRSDMVVCYHALSFVDQDWRRYLARVAALAKKVLIVTVCNPDNWGVAIIRSLGRLRGIQGVEAPESWQLPILAPELWKHGRVREHTYFDCPWWPDLQVSPGQSLTDRLKRLVAVKKKFNFTDTHEESKVADKYVYDDARWPYFGGPGWVEELLPGLLKHPCFEGASKTVRARTAHLHGFVVDMRPRTPRERRRLTQVAGERDSSR